MKHIIKVEVLENLPTIRPLIAMDANREFFVQQKAPGPPNNEFWYTTSDGNIITPYETSSLPEIDTNTYSDGKGIIKFKTDVTSIGQKAFMRRRSLTSMMIPNSITSIGSYAFRECSSMTSINISDSATIIGEEAFCYCGLTSITIPDSVTSIGSSAFGGCGSLTIINVETNNPNYCSVEGVLFNKDKTTLIQYLGGKYGAYTIPNSVTSIGKKAFWWCTALTSVTIGNSVTSIGAYAFEECSSLSSVVIGNSVTSIGTEAFQYCSSLTSVTIGNSVTSIGDRAFDGCESLPIIDNIRYADTYLITVVDKTQSSYTIKSDTKWIGTSAFQQCKSLTSITIPNGVTSIGHDAFMYCSSLTSVTIPNSVTSIGGYAFDSCKSLTSVTILNGVTRIGDHAFASCESLTSVTIPNSVTSIGDGAFDGCVSLPIIDNIRYTDTYLITVVDKTQSSYTIQEGTNRIGHNAFYNCTNLTSIEIPDSVMYIDEYAFGQISAKILFSKLYSTYTNKIVATPTSDSKSYTCNVEFNISEIPTDYNISSMLPQSDGNGKYTLTYNIYTDYEPCKDQALALANTKTIVNVYHIDGTPWE